MSWFVAMHATNTIPADPFAAAGKSPMIDLEWKVVSPLHGSKYAASLLCAELRLRRHGTFRVFDADHEPGRSILRSRNPFA